jgi:hypothetical protein
MQMSLIGQGVTMQKDALDTLEAFTARHGSGTHRELYEALTRPLVHFQETTLKTRQSQATVYKQDRSSTHNYVEPSVAIGPVSRGFKLNCLVGELPVKQRAIDAFWSKAYFEAQTVAGRQAVVDQEKEWRQSPREWV